MLADEAAGSGVSVAAVAVGEGRSVGDSVFVFGGEVAEDAAASETEALCPVVPGSDD
jgi:hypothetical protein